MAQVCERSVIESTVTLMLIVDGLSLCDLCLVCEFLT